MQNLETNHLGKDKEMLEFTLDYFVSVMELLCNINKLMAIVTQSMELPYHSTPRFTMSLFIATKSIRSLTLLTNNHLQQH